MNFYARNHSELFEHKQVLNNEDVYHQPFDMDDDYGFYEDFEEESVVDHPCDEDSDSVPSPRLEDKKKGSFDSSPPILTSTMVDRIVEDGLPWSMQDMKWNRLFSSSRDGTNFGTFMRNVRGQGETIVVAKTSDCRVVGGFATDPWSGRKPSDTSGGSAFLFCATPQGKSSMTPSRRQSSQLSFGTTYIPGLEDLGTSPTSALDFDFAAMTVTPKRDNRGHVDIFKANGGLKQVCQLGNKLISMGDGENMSLFIESSFSRGSCATGEAEKDEFDIIEFEVYGFSED